MSQMVEMFLNSMVSYVLCFAANLDVDLATAWYNKRLTD